MPTGEPATSSLVCVTAQTMHPANRSLNGAFEVGPRLGWAKGTEGRVMVELSSDSRAVPSDCMPGAIAPIDDGSNAVELAERILAASTLLPSVRIGVRLRSGRWTWRGRINGWTRHDAGLQLLASDAVVEVNLASVIAVSYCADLAASGVCLCDEGGTFLTLWSGDSSAFDAWLESVLREPERSGRNVVGTARARSSACH